LFFENDNLESKSLLKLFIIIEVGLCVLTELAINIIITRTSVDWWSLGIIFTTVILLFKTCLTVFIMVALDIIKIKISCIEKIIFWAKSAEVPEDCDKINTRD